MTKEEFKILCKIMKAVYPQPTFLPDAYAFKVWYELLEDLDYTVAQAAIEKYILTNKFPPTIADIREYAVLVRTRVMYQKSKKRLEKYIEKRKEENNES